MAHVRIVTVGKGTVVRHIDMTGYTIKAVDQAAISLDSIICLDKDILKVTVDYDGCDDSKTVENYTP